ncbi:MAG: hypothetical protein LBU83_03235 [Bacteroidales bacterium]|jgi:hypothetical protein|nr:hypothetical protein [Bacteroidales bacterium]
MKKLLLVFGILIFNIALIAQTPYYYNNKGQKQYLSFNTKYAFLSLNEPIIPENIIQRSINYSEFQSDNSNKKQYQEKFETTRYYTRLSFSETLSEEQYLNLLSDIKHQNQDAIIAPYFKTNHSERIGLSNFFYVKVKEKGDTMMLRQIAELYECIIIEQDAFMPLWFVLSTTEASELNALECCNIFQKSDLIQVAEPNLMFENMLLNPNNNICPTNDTIEAVLMQQQLAKGINWAWQNGADVLSNSWKQTLFTLY